MASNSTKRAAIYARISETGKDRDKVADQIAMCRRMASRRGYEVVATFQDDGISALGSKARPGFNALLDGILSNAFEVVLASEEERFARNVKDKADLQAACIEGGVVWETDRDGFVDPATEAGEFFSTMRAAMGRMESRRKAARQRAANLDRAAVGKPNPGRRRYGYHTDGIRPIESEAAVVRRMFDHVADGGSLRSLMLALIEEQVDPAPGKNWNARRLRHILLSPHYSGFVTHLGVTTPSDVIIPVVDESLAADVRAIMMDAARTTSPGPKVKHLLSGLVYCGECGDRMFFMRGYICRTSTSHAQIKADFLERRVLDEVAKAFVSGGANLFPEAANGSTMRGLMAEHERNVQAVAQIIADRDEGLVPTSVARIRLVELREVRERIESELDKQRNSKSSAGALLEMAQSLLTADTYTIGDYETMKANVLERFAALDLDRRREIIRALVHVEVKKGRDTNARVLVEHKLAVHLNPDSDTDSRYYSDAF